MEEFFSEYTYYEFPSIQAAIFALLLSFVLSSVIAFTYRYTFRGVNYSKNLFQAIVLISIIAATIMMSIGDSLARGLGILGALAIIRFRYRFDNPKNIIYIFASVAVGIGCGVYGFAIAAAGTLVFSMVSFVLYFSPMGKSSVFETSLTFLLDDTSKLSSTEDILHKYCDAFKLLSIGSSAELVKYEYNLSVRNDTDKLIFYQELSDNDGVSNVRINNRGSVDRV